MDTGMIRGDGVELSRVPCVGEYVLLALPGSQSYWSHEVRAVTHFPAGVEPVDALIRVERPSPPERP